MACDPTSYMHNKCKKLPPFPIPLFTFCFHFFMNEGIMYTSYSPVDGRSYWLPDGYGYAERIK